MSFAEQQPVVAKLQKVVVKLQPSAVWQQPCFAEQQKVVVKQQPDQFCAETIVSTCAASTSRRL